MESIILPISGNDIQKVVDLWNKTLPLDSISPETFIARVILDENFDEKHVLIAKENEQIIGFVIAACTKTNIYKEVDPENKRCWITSLAVDFKHRKKGMGKKLLNSLFEQFRLENKKECYIATYPFGYFTPGVDIHEYKDGVEFLKSVGFVEKYRPLSMDSTIVLIKISDEVKNKTAALENEGIQVIPFEYKYIISYLKYMETMPSDWLRVARNNLIDLTKGYFSPDQIFIAVKGDEVIGYCQFEGPHFGPFGVSEKYQGKGIGTVLLAKTIEMMKIKGYHNAWVMWTDDIAAKVYQKLGFRETRRFVVLSKDL